MRKLSQIIASALVAATALGAALPAQAQVYRDYDRYEGRYDGRYEGRYDDRDGNRYDDRYGNRYDDYRRYGLAQDIRAQINELQRRVERVDYRDRISEREAAGLRNAVYGLRQQFRDYNRDGLSQREARILHDRIHDVRQRLRFERQDRDGRRW